MTKRLSHDLTYDAPLSEVAAMLGDPAFREQVCADQHVLRHEVGVEPSGAGKKVRVSQVQSARGLPSFAAKLVGDEITIVQEETWSGPERADLAVTIPGKPGEMSGTITLRESGGVTTQTVDISIRVGIPLVGGKVEGLVADMLVKALESENRTGRAYLS